MFEEHKHYSHDLEAGVIGACLLETSAFARVYDLLKPEIFYSNENQTIFSHLVEMFETNRPISLITVVDFTMREKGVKILNGSSAAYALTVKTNAVKSTANLEYEAHCLLEMFLEREVIKLTMGGINPDLTVKEQIYSLQNRLQNLTQRAATGDWQDMSELMVNLYKHQDKMRETGGIGVLTGIPTIDRIYGGFHPGQMIVIAARPSVGKSALSGQISLSMAQNGAKVGIVSLEMNNTEIAARLAALDTSVDFNAVFRGLYADERQRQNFYDRVSKNTSALPIYVTDATDVNITDIKAKAHKLKAKKGLDCLVIDYLQLVGGDEKRNRSRENEVASISRGCKIIAKELEVPLIVLAQLNREVERRKGKDRFPILADLRESGAIEQDADVAMFLHSDYKSGFTENEHGESTENQAHLIIRKWRNAPPNVIIDLDFDGPRMQFVERTFKPNFRPLKNHYEPKSDENPF